MIEFKQIYISSRNKPYLYASVDYKKRRRFFGIPVSLWRKCTFDEIQEYMRGNFIVEPYMYTQCFCIRRRYIVPFVGSYWDFDSRFDRLYTTKSGAYDDIWNKLVRKER